MTEEEQFAEKGKKELKRVAKELALQFIPAMEALLERTERGERIIVVGDWVDESPMQGGRMRAVALNGRIMVIAGEEAEVVSQTLTDVMGTLTYTGMEKGGRTFGKTGTPEAG